MKEYLLFPKKHYYLTQGYAPNAYSHKYSKALDVSASQSGDYDIFAPFSGYVGKIYISKTPKTIAHTIWLVSNDKVICADGIERYAVVSMTHPEGIANFKKGDKFNQGEFLFKDGKTGGVGTHLHLEVAVFENKKDIVVNWYKSAGTSWVLSKCVNPCEYMCMKDDCKVLKNTYLGKEYSFKKVSEVPKERPYIEKGASYKLLYEKALRKKPSMSGVIVKVQQVDKITQTLSTKKTGDFYFKVGTIIDPREIINEKNGRVWASYGNCWWCLQNIDGKHNAIRID